MIQATFPPKTDCSSRVTLLETEICHVLSVSTFRSEVASSGCCTLRVSVFSLAETMLVSCVGCSTLAWRGVRIFLFFPFCVVTFQSFLTQFQHFPTSFSHSFAFSFSYVIVLFVECLFCRSFWQILGFFVL